LRCHDDPLERLLEKLRVRNLAGRAKGLLAGGQDHLLDRLDHRAVVCFGAREACEDFAGKIVEGGCVRRAFVLRCTLTLSNRVGTSLTADWELGSAFDLGSVDVKSISSWQEQQVDDGFLDLDATELSLLEMWTTQKQRQTQISQGSG
jgi:hypothetical protein